MNIYWSKLAAGLEPYTPGEQPRGAKLIKLNTNENPYPPSPRVLNAIKEAADASLRLYPDPVCEDFRCAVAEYYGADKDQIFAGNGSDEILAFCFPAFFNSDEPILFPDISYSFFPVYAGYYKQDYRSVQLDRGFNIPVSEFLRPNGGIIIANPNPPSGVCLPAADVERIVKGNPGHVVIVDEAYIDFGGESVVSLVNTYANLLVVQTLSKSRSLAGLRAGCAIGDRNLIAALNTVKNCFNSYTMGRIALAGGAEAFRDRGYFEETRRRVMSTRDRVRAALLELGFTVPESCANFIFAGFAGISGSELYARLREKGILVRHFMKPALDGYIRVSIGIGQDMDIFLAAIKEILRSAGVVKQ